jgi:hypothetical protein
VQPKSFPGAAAPAATSSLGAATQDSNLLHITR